MHETLDPRRPTSRATRDLPSELGAAIDRARRSVRMRAAAGAAVLLVLTAWGTWLHAQVKSFAAADAAVIARVEVASALPPARGQLADHLRRSAPDLVGRAVQSLLRSPAYFRERLERMIGSEIPGMAERLKTELAEEIRETIRASRLALESDYPGMGDLERFDRMSDELAQGYRARLAHVTEAYAGPYRSSLEGLRRRLETLADSGGRGDKEEIEREILVTFLEMHARARERGEVDVLSKGVLTLPLLRDE